MEPQDPTLESTSIVLAELVIVPNVTPVVISGLIAFFRGFIQESLSLALWIFAFAAAMFLDEYLDPYISVYITNDELKRIASLFIIFTGIIFSGGFAIKIIKNLTFWLSESTFKSLDSAQALSKTPGNLFLGPEDEISGFSWG